MSAVDSTAAGTSRGERGTTFMLALFLGAIQIGWLGLLLWVTYQIAGVV